MVELKNVTKIYKTESREVVALENVSFVLPDTGLVCIHGKSGSGKTTLLNVISGIDDFQQGDILIENYSYSHFNEKAMDDFRNTHIGMIFQNFNLFEHMTVFENVEFPLKIQKEYPKGDLHDYSNKILSYVGLSGLGKANISELSGGQKQRVAIARAIIKSPQMILADEPTGNLDMATSAQIMSLLKRISSDKLVIVVSHDEDLCKTYADMIIRISDGKIKEINTQFAKASKENDAFADACEIFSRKQRTPKKLSAKNTLRFSINVMSNKAVRLSFTMVVFVLTLFLLELFVYISYYNDGTVIKKYLQRYPQDGIGFYRQVSYEDLFYKEHSKKISGGENFYSLLKSNYGSDDLIKVTAALPIRSVESDRLSKEINCVLSTPGYERKYELSTGRYTESADEVLITEYLAKQLILSAEEAIDNFMYIGNMLVEIVGIIETDYRAYGLESKLETQQDVEYTMYHYNKEYNIMILNEGFIDEYRENSDFLSIAYSNFFYGDREVTYFLDASEFSYGKVSQYTELVAGRMPQESGEVLISKDLFLIYMNKGSETNIGDSAEANFDFSQTEYSFIDIYSPKYNGYYNDSLNLYDYFNEITVVGVFEYDDSYQGLKADVLMTEKIYDIVSADYYDFYLATNYILQNESYSTENIVDFCNKNNILIDEPSILQIYNFKNTIQNFIRILRIVALVLVIVTLFMLLSYVSNSISSNIRAIGILRSLGVRKRDTLKIFIAEALLICLLSLVLSIIGLAVFADYCNLEFAKSLVENKFDIVVINIPQLLIISMLTVIFTLSSLTVPIVLLAKKTPIQIINGQK